MSVNMEVRRKKEIGYLLLRDHLAHGNRLNANIGFILLLLNVLVLSDIYKKKDCCDKNQTCLQILPAILSCIKNVL